MTAGSSLCEPHVRSMAGGRPACTGSNSMSLDVRSFPSAWIAIQACLVILQTLLDGLRAVCAGFPGKRRGGDVTYSMADIGMSVKLLRSANPWANGPMYLNIHVNPRYYVPPATSRDRLLALFTKDLILSECECIGPNAGIEELDFESMVGYRTFLADELVETLAGHDAGSIL